MADVLHKTADPIDYRKSQHEPDFPTVDWFHDPDVSAVSAVPTKYWRVGTNPVQEMNQAEKDAVDAAEAAAALASRRALPVGETTDVTGEGIRIRALVELLNKRDNYIINRISELQTAFDDVKASTGAADNIRAAIPASWLATATRTKAQAMTDLTDDINAGNQDT